MRRTTRRKTVNILDDQHCPVCLFVFTYSSFVICYLFFQFCLFVVCLFVFHLFGKKTHFFQTSVRSRQNEITDLPSVPFRFIEIAATKKATLGLYDPFSLSPTRREHFGSADLRSAKRR